jgi:hypothetical protein
MPILLSNPETINIDGAPVVATHVEIAKIVVVTGDRVTTASGAFDLQFGNMVDPGDGTPLRFEGIPGAIRHYVARYIPASTEAGFNPASGEYESVEIPAVDEVNGMVQFMGVHAGLQPYVDAEIQAGLDASETAAEIGARVAGVLAGKGMNMVFGGGYAWLLTNGHVAGVPE